MKNTIILLCSILFVSCATSKHISAVNSNYRSLKSFHKDTIAYFQYNFIDNQDKYIGKSVDEVLKDLEIPIVHFVPLAPERKNKSNGLSLSYYDKVTNYVKSQNGEKFCELIVVFDQDVVYDDLSTIKKKFGDGLTPELSDYLGKQTVKELELYKSQMPYKPKAK